MCRSVSVLYATRRAFCTKHRARTICAKIHEHDPVREKLNHDIIFFFSSINPIPSTISSTISIEELFIHRGHVTEPSSSASSLSKKKKELHIYLSIREQRPFGNNVCQPVELRQLVLLTAHRSSPIQVPRRHDRSSAVYLSWRYSRI
jgi:hypothetical protein